MDTALNDIGQLAFLAGYSNPSGFYTAIMGTDLSGNLFEIARTGQQIDVDSGPAIDLRTISTFFQYDDGYNQDNDLIRISPLGHVLFRAIHRWIQRDSSLQRGGRTGAKHGGSYCHRTSGTQAPSALDVRGVHPAS